MISQLDRIVPHIKELAPYISNADITEIMVNRDGQEVFIERHGKIERVSETVSPKGLENAIKNITRFCQNEAGPGQPMVEARLEDGSRVAAMLRPCSVDGATLTIRKFGHHYSLTDLVTTGSVPESVARLLRNAVAARKNILISGSTNAGKRVCSMRWPT
jgi:pilus assembly protein CpaF